MLKGEATWETENRIVLPLELSDDLENTHQLQINNKTKSLTKRFYQNNYGYINNTLNRKYFMGSDQEDEVNTYKPEHARISGSFGDSIQQPNLSNDVIKDSFKNFLYSNEGKNIIIDIINKLLKPSSATFLATTTDAIPMANYNSFSISKQEEIDINDVDLSIPDSATRKSKVIKTKKLLPNMK